MPGGITNVNYRVDADGQAFVVRIATEGTERFGIDRLREYRCATAASRTGVAPEVVYALLDEGILVTRFVVGRPLSRTEMAKPEVMKRVAQSMHRYHEGPAFEGSFSPFRTIEAYLREARHSGAPLPEDIDEMHSRVREIEAALRPDQMTVAPCHNDLWGPNLIDDGLQVYIVDWEYAGMGDLFFDLANFAMYQDASDGQSDVQDEALLRAYFGEVSNAALARLKLLKVVAEIREALWYVVGLTVSSARSDFAGHAEIHFTRYRQALGDPRLPSWLDAAARIA